MVNLIVLSLLGLLVGCMVLYIRHVRIEDEERRARMEAKWEEDEREWEATLELRRKRKSKSRLIQLNKAQTPEDFLLRKDNIRRDFSRAED